LIELTAIGRYCFGIDFSAAVSMRSHSFGSTDTSIAGMIWASSTSRCGKNASRTATIASRTAV
jgi:hypothetical protein